MNVISTSNEVLDASVSLKTIDGTFGLVLESRGGAKGKSNQRNIDYLPALDTLLHRLNTIGVETIRIHVVSSRALKIWEPSERLIKIEGNNDILLKGVNLKELRRKISTAQQNKKENLTSKGGNPTKRILLEADIGRSSWMDVVTGSPEANIPISEIDIAEVPVEFSPEEVETEKEMVSRSVALRRGQPAFRKKLLNAYKNTCAISGTSFPPILEAAHIIPYMGKKTNHVTNGLLLRTDLHTLFDLGLLGINQIYEVVVSSRLKNTEYEKYNGVKISLPTSKNECPSLSALKTRPLPAR